MGPGVYVYVTSIKADIQLYCLLKSILLCFIETNPIVGCRESRGCQFVVGPEVGKTRNSRHNFAHDIRSRHLRKVTTGQVYSVSLVAIVVLEIVFCATKQRCVYCIIICSLYNLNLY